MKSYIKKGEPYTDITSAGNVIVPCAESRAFLATIGLAGEIVPTPGHSDDSVSLVLDTGAAFTGDLTAPGLASEESGEAVAESWAKIRALGATTVYAGHGPVRPIGNV